MTHSPSGCGSSSSPSPSTSSSTEPPQSSSSFDVESLVTELSRKHDASMLKAILAWLETKPMYGVRVRSRVETLTRGDTLSMTVTTFLEPDLDLEPGEVVLDLRPVYP